jgi:hypothetical protein
MEAVMSIELWIGVGGLVLGVINVVALFLPSRYGKRLSLYRVLSYEVVDPVISVIPDVTLSIKDRHIPASLSFLLLYVENSGRNDIKRDPGDTPLTLTLGQEGEWYGAKITDNSVATCNLIPESPGSLEVGFQLLRRRAGFFVVGIVSAGSDTVVAKHDLYDVDPSVSVRQSDIPSRAKRYLGAAGLGLFVGGASNLASELPHPSWSLTGWISWAIGTAIGGVLAYRYFTGGPGAWRRPPRRIRRAAEGIVAAAEENGRKAAIATGVDSGLKPS